MIKIGIVGFGNLGKAVFNCVKNFKDIKLICVFSRRDLKNFSNEEILFDKYENISQYKNKIDVMIMCGGSKSDLRWQSPEVLKDFCVVDSFDTHAKIFDHFQTLNTVGRKNQKLSLLSCGWDPGVFSLMRILFSSIANKTPTTFWGNGISQGHSDAIRRIDGVLDARAFTLLKHGVVKKVLCGKVEKISPQKAHKRKCFVAIKDGVSKNKIKEKIKLMPNYFLGYKTQVKFLKQKVLNKNYSNLFHGGCVACCFKSFENNLHKMCFSLKLESNPEFTASVLLCYSRALYKMFCEKNFGAITVFDIPFSYLSCYSKDELLKKWL